MRRLIGAPPRAPEPAGSMRRMRASGVVLQRRRSPPTGASPPRRRAAAPGGASKCRLPHRARRCRRGALRADRPQLLDAAIAGVRADLTWNAGPCSPTSPMSPDEPAGRADRPARRSPAARTRVGVGVVRSRRSASRRDRRATRVSCRPFTGRNCLSPAHDRVRGSHRDRAGRGGQRFFERCGAPSIASVSPACPADRGHLRAPRAYPATPRAPSAGASGRR